MVQRIAFRSSLLAFVLAASTALVSGSVLAAGPLQIIVSKDQQSLVVYDGDTVIATSRVSTGKKGHSTPTGIFSVLQKARHHRSNIYSDAPMPFMQRLTWSGIALHASGHVPSYPASHGCVRLPNDFAKTLYGMTSMGAQVLVSDRQVQPQAIADAFLFQPRAPSPPLLSDVELRPSVTHAPPSQAVEVASSESAEPAKPAAMPEGSPLRMIITWRGQREKIADAQAILSELGFVPGMADGVAGQQTIEAVKAYQASENIAVDGRIDDALLALLYKKTNRGMPANGQLLVRRDFKPLFETPITIASAEIALGTHFLQFHAQPPSDADEIRGKWFATTMDNALSAPMKKRLGITLDSDPLAFNAVERTLDRLRLDDDGRQKIEEMLVDGSSLTITDNGLGPETGQGTDFITITHPAAKG